MKKDFKGKIRVKIRGVKIRVKKVTLRMSGLVTRKFLMKRELR